MLRFISEAMSGARRFTSRRPLAFMHIPKCSGTALRTALETSIGSKNTIIGVGASSFGGYRNFESFDPGVRKRVYMDARELPKGATFITGHLDYALMKAAYPNAQFLTVLREPAERLMSTWLYWRGYTDEEIAMWGDFGRRLETSRGPLAAFLGDRQLASQIDNAFARMLLHPHALIPPDDFIEERHADALAAEAWRVLESCSFVDVVENPDFEKRLAQWLGRPLEIERINESRTLSADRETSLEAEMTPEARAALTARARVDLQLWRRVAAASMPGRDIEALREAALAKTMQRHDRLMRGAG